MQPISETAENVKETSGNDCENLNTFGNEEYSQNEFLSTSELSISDGIRTEKESPASNNAIIPGFKDDYSACNRLIEKFQEAVIDSAVRIIQAYFKRFYQRKKFLRLKKAVSVIQRSLRNWLQKKKNKHKTQENSAAVIKTKNNILESCTNCIEDATSYDEFAKNMTNDDCTLDDVDHEDCHCTDEEVDCQSECYNAQSINSECDSCGKDDQNDNDSDYGSGEIDCVCIICGGLGCYPTVYENTNPSSELLPNDLFVFSS